MARLAVFASGRGSNLQAIKTYLETTNHVLALVVTDREHSGAHALALEWGVQVSTPRYFKNGRAQAEQTILEDLRVHRIDFIALAGFMRILSPNFTNRWQGRLINLHPSLLPKYPGAQGIKEGYESNDSELGITIHFVDAGIDTGQIIFQDRFSRDGGESLEEIETLIHSLEHTGYPRVIRTFLDALDTEEGIS
jgi:phosphoribosylglycinamide formyltransferase-1